MQRPWEHRGATVSGNYPEVFRDVFGVDPRAEAVGLYGFYVVSEVPKGDFEREAGAVPGDLCVIADGAGDANDSRFCNLAPNFRGRAPFPAPRCAAYFLAPLGTRG